VYVFKDAKERVLYVGKSGCLARRLRSYFKGTRSLDAKLRRLRDQVVDVAYTPVGSELEALLEEHRLIQRLAPPVNVQRRIAEDRSRYHPPLHPVAVLAPSVRAGRISLFVFGPGLTAVQRHLDPRRPPVRALRAILDYALGTRPRLPASAGATDWGDAGREICLRYFCRFRGRLQWLELHRAVPAETLIREILHCAGSVVDRDPEPGEFLVE
jgi:hypothetical protein